MTIDQAAATAAASQAEAKTNVADAATDSAAAKPPQLDPAALRDDVLAAAVQRRLARVLGKADPAAGDHATTAVAMLEWNMVSDGRISEAQLVEAYAAVTGLPVGEDEEFNDLEHFPDVTYDYLLERLCIPLSWTESTTLIAVAHVYGIGRLQWQWQAMFNRKPTFMLARRTQIERALSLVYEAGNDNAEAEPGWNVDSSSEEALRDLAREAPVVRLVNDMFSRAIEMGASDIHVEPAENDLAIRYRIDGVLQTVLTPPRNQYAAIASRLKLLANLNIAEHRLPQDGRIDLDIGRTPIDVRVSSVPSMHGESIVLRLLQKDTSSFDLDHLGLDADRRAAFESLVSSPHGMILVVGPTGSGKTTTLYSVMRLLNNDVRKIITIEDPVEYQLSGLTQIQVRSSIGLTFSQGLRAIVRQDPDVILVGEIRDRETAEIAIHAALTGHLVFSTLHTNDAAGAISRLQEMGVESFLISSALLGILSQRLVRRICPACNGSGNATAAEQPQPRRNCRNCSGSGYRGRVGIFELLLVNESIRRGINEHVDSTEIAALARQYGMRSLREDGERKVGEGLTTAAEVARVCQLDNFG